MLLYLIKTRYRLITERKKRTAFNKAPSDMIQILIISAGKNRIKVADHPFSENTFLLMIKFWTNTETAVAAIKPNKMPSAVLYILYPVSMPIIITVQ
jgi:hypothetical protein